MLTELKRVIKALNFAPVNTTLKGEAADAAIRDGLEYFRKNKTSFYLDRRALNSAISGLKAVDKAGLIPGSRVADLIAELKPRIATEVLAMNVSAYATLIHQGQTNQYWSKEAQLIAKEACKSFNI